MPITAVHGGAGRGRLTRRSQLSGCNHLEFMGIPEPQTITRANEQCCGNALLFVLLNFKATAQLFLIGNVRPTVSGLAKTYILPTARDLLSAHLDTTRLHGERQVVVIVRLV